MVSTLLTTQQIKPQFKEPRKLHFVWLRSSWSGLVKQHLKDGVLVVEDCSVNNSCCDEESETTENQKKEKETQLSQDLVHE